MQRGGWSAVPRMQTVPPDSGSVRLVGTAPPGEPVASSSWNDTRQVAQQAPHASQGLPTTVLSRLAERGAQNIRRPIAQAMAEMSAVAGMVRIQAQTMPPATPQRTFFGPRVAPTPAMAPVMV